MPFKINISKDGKTLKLETESESLLGRRIGETIKGQSISPDLAGYEIEITGTSDKAGFPGKKDVEGITLKKVLLTKGFALHKKPRGESKKSKPLVKGVRMRKTVRGNTISASTIQINTKVKKEGSKKFQELLPKKEEPKQDDKTEQKTDKKEQIKQEKKPEQNKEKTPEKDNKEKNQAEK
jgi:small subunit ribosomal protein S6e